jgi:hypothetical protein
MDDASYILLCWRFEDVSRTCAWVLGTHAQDHNRVFKLKF